MSELVVSAGCTDAAAFNYDAEANNDYVHMMLLQSCAKIQQDHTIILTMKILLGLSLQMGEISILLSGSTESGYDYLTVALRFTGDLEELENNVITMTVNSDSSVSSEDVFGWTVLVAILLDRNSICHNNYDSSANTDDGSCLYPEPDTVATLNSLDVRKDLININSFA